MERHRMLTAKAFIDGRTRIIFSAIIDATTFSGSPSTTYDNTTINTSVNHFCAEEAKVDPFISCKGDDSNNMLHEFTDHHKIIYEDIWRGLGLILKKINVGDYTSFGFCSTDLIIEGDTCKFVRQLDRMNPLTHWSQEALGYSSLQLKNYYQELAIGLEGWTNGMPFYASYPQALRKMSILVPNKGKIPKSGKPKNSYPTRYKYTESTWKVDRLSNNIVSNHAVYEFLFKKYGLTRSMIHDSEARLDNYNLFSYTA